MAIKGTRSIFNPWIILNGIAAGLSLFTLIKDFNFINISIIISIWLYQYNNFLYFFIAPFENIGIYVSEFQRHYTILCLVLLSPAVQQFISRKKYQIQSHAILIVASILSILFSQILYYSSYLFIDMHNFIINFLNIYKSGLNIEGLRFSYCISPLLIILIYGGLINNSKIYISRLFYIFGVLILLILINNIFL